MLNIWINLTNTNALLTLEILSIFFYGKEEKLLTDVDKHWKLTCIECYRWQRLYIGQARPTQFIKQLYKLDTTSILTETFLFYSKEAMKIVLWWVRTFLWVGNLFKMLTYSLRCYRYYCFKQTMWPPNWTHYQLIHTLQIPQKMCFLQAKSCIHHPSSLE